MTAWFRCRVTVPNASIPSILESLAMFLVSIRFGLTALLSGAVLGSCVPATQAQPRLASSVMPTLRTAPDQAVSQFANNIRTLGRAYANVSPWSSDSNPYAPSYTPDMNGYAGSP